MPNMRSGLDTFWFRRFGDDLGIAQSCWLDTYLLRAEQMCAMIALVLRLGGSKRLNPRRDRVAAACSWAVVLALLAAVGMCGCRTLGKPAEPLRTVGQVTSLREDEIAAGRHVALRGVITLLDPGWRLLAIQDESGGMLVEWPPLPANLRVGDLVEMTGATSVDNHIPSVVAASLRVVGTGSLPRPQPASPDSIACGNILYRLVEVEIVPDEGSLGDDVHTAYFGVQRPAAGWS